MSFILDALKKSENERQQQGGPELSSVPVSSDAPRSMRWLWLISLLLLVNLAVLIGILMRPGASPAPPPAPAAAGIEQSSAPAAETAPPVAAASFAEQLAVAREQAPVPASPTPQAAAADSERTAAPVTMRTPQQRVPSIDELRLDGSLELPELHVDIHVYSEVPAERFVFINMIKHREQSQLAEGPVVEEITADGVILEYRGRRFLLSRE